MDKRCSLLLMALLLVSGSLACKAKTVKFGKYIILDVEKYKKKEGAFGGGTLQMRTESSYMRNGNQYPIMYDVLKGTFNGFSVIDATLSFNSGWTFKGTVDYQIDSLVSR